jgi:hypothetical protein
MVQRLLTTRRDQFRMQSRKSPVEELLVNFYFILLWSYGERNIATESDLVITAVIFLLFGEVCSGNKVRMD